MNSDSAVQLETAVGGKTELMEKQKLSLPAQLASAVRAVQDEWVAKDNVRRLWRKDAGLWTGQDEGQWMDWLDIVRQRAASLDDLQGLAYATDKERFQHVLLLGMGGSSLGPEVMRKTFGKLENCPELHVLDSTDPAQVRAAQDRIDPARTLFIVSSKSGSTLEPNILMDYFYQVVGDAVGPDQAAGHFVAVTDPGSQLEQVATEQGFRRIYHGVPGIGGRYSVLSNFGVVPAAAMGLDVGDLLERATRMVQACGADVPVGENPGVTLGIVLGVAGKLGRDKVTLVVSPAISSLGTWLEQLLAESTGKLGRGLIPIDQEAVGAVGNYGTDRLFVYLRLDSGANPEQDSAIQRLEDAGQPVVTISIAAIEDLAQEFFRWEIATAVAGAVLGINPFDQPDVEASKVATRTLTDAYEASGVLPQEAPLASDGELQLFTDSRNADVLLGLAGGQAGCAGLLRAHLSRVVPGDYVALLAYLEMNDAHQQALQPIRHYLRDAHRVATCLEFGPRFLHSTGQAYKGGPNSGVFVQITCNDLNDLQVPGRKFSFGIVKAAQARGDFQVLAERGRRVLRIHLGDDTQAGLAKLRDWIQE